MKAAQMRRLLGRTVYLSFREQRGKHILEGVPLTVVDVGLRTVLLELPSGEESWVRLSIIMGYWEKAIRRTVEGSRENDRTKPKR